MATPAPLDCALATEFIAPELVESGPHWVIRSLEVPEAFFWNVLLLDQRAPLPDETDLDGLATKELSSWAETGHRTLLRPAAWSVEDEAELQRRGFLRDPIDLLVAPRQRVAASSPHPSIAPLVAKDRAGWAEIVDSRCSIPSPWPAEAYRRVIAGRLERWRRVVAADRARWWRFRVDGRTTADLGIATSGQSLRYAMIFVMPEWRRQGQARALIKHAASVSLGFAGAQNAVNTLRIGVGPDHPAMALYRGLGFEPERRLDYWIRWPKEWTS